MAGYLNQNGNSIGSLLRFIQEQKSQSPIIPQGSEVGSPIRDVVQQPLKGSEGQGTSKVVSLRPEGTLTPSGNPIEQGTPQSSRVGPISIGGTDVGPVAPPTVVAANEPGQGFTIPSATRTAGDVLNRTGSASVKTPSLGTTIKASTPTTKSGVATAITTKGQEVGNYNLLKDKAQADKTFDFIKGAVQEGERSVPETIANQNETYDAMNSGPSTQEIDAQILARGMKNINTKGTPENLALLASVKKDLERIKNQPSPTPTPMPMQGEIGQVQGASTSSGGGSSGGSSGGGGGTTSGVMRSVAPRVAPAPIQSKNQYSTPVPIRSVAAPAQSKPAPSKPAAKAPSIGTILGGGALQGLKKLFGWK